VKYFFNNAVSDIRFDF